MRLEWLEDLLAYRRPWRARGGGAQAADPARLLPPDPHIEDHVGVDLVDRSRSPSG